MVSLAYPETVKIRQTRFGWVWTVDNGRNLSEHGTSRYLGGAVRQARRSLRRIRRIHGGAA